MIALATKTISITVDAYKRLASSKMERESFSQVICRLTNKTDLTKFAGILSKKTAATMEKAVQASRAAGLARSRALMEGLQQ